MRKNIAGMALAVGVGVFALWYLVVLAYVFPRTGMGIAFGVSIAVNAAVLTNFVLTRTRTSSGPHEGTRSDL